MFAILRFDKLKSEGAIGASSSHMMRTRPTPNADLSISNKILIGSQDPKADVDARLNAASQRRKNSVLAIEVLASASPEWFETATNVQKKQWVISTRDWFKKEFGEENVAHLQLHLDESTPHITGFVVPIDPETQRLNAARWLDGSARLAKLQTNYASEVQNLGLERGLEGSDATHIAMKQLHAATKIEVPTDIKTLKSQARAGDMAQKKARAYQKTAERYREEVQAARDIPLDEVAEKLHLHLDKYDKSKWKDDFGNFAITINQTKFFDHLSEKGGGGAIDLVMLVLSCDFKEAVSWLGHEIGAEEAARAFTAKAASEAKGMVKQAMKSKPEFTLPKRSEDFRTRKTVSDYLTETRGLDKDLIKSQADLGTIYADEKANAVFVAVQSDGEKRGAELRGTGLKPFHGLLSGSDRDACFLVKTQPDAPSPALVLVEGAIDALSYAQLHRDKNLLVASSGGARPKLPQSLEAKLNEFSEVIVAYDNDKQGERSAKKLIEYLTQLGKKVSRHLPWFGKDWNNVVIHQRQKSNEELNEQSRVNTEGIGCP